MSLEGQNYYNYNFFKETTKDEIINEKYYFSYLQSPAGFL